MAVFPRRKEGKETPRARGRRGAERVERAALAVEEGEARRAVPLEGAEEGPPDDRGDGVPVRRVRRAGLEKVRERVRPEERVREAPVPGVGDEAHEPAGERGARAVVQAEALGGARGRRFLQQLQQLGGLWW